MAVLKFAEMSTAAKHQANLSISLKYVTCFML